MITLLVKILIILFFLNLHVSNSYYQTTSSKIELGLLSLYSLRNVLEMVFIIGSGFDKPGLNSGQSSLHFTLH